MNISRRLITVLLSLSIAACSRTGGPAPVPSPPSSPAQDTVHWQKITILPATTLTDIYFTDTSHGFLASLNGQIYRSADGGRSWQAATDTLVLSAFMQFDFLNPGQGYCIGTRSTVSTMDGGQSWRPHARPPVADQPWAKLQFLSPSTGYFTSGTGTYKTMDTGNTWQKMDARPAAGLYFSDVRTGLIYTQPDSLYRTTDGGLSWQPFSIIPNTQPVTSDIFTVFQFTDPMHGWMMDATVLEATKDGGHSWTQQLRSLNGNATFFTNFHMTDNQTGFLMTPEEIMKTSDGGTTWNSVYKDSTNIIVGFFAVDGTHAWASCHNGIILKYRP